MRHYISPSSQAIFPHAHVHTSHFMVICAIAENIETLKRGLHLLVSALDGAVPLVEVDDIAEFITCGGRDNKKMRRGRMWFPLVGLR